MDGCTLTLTGNAQMEIEVQEKEIMEVGEGEVGGEDDVEGVGDMDVDSDEIEIVEEGTETKNWGREEKGKGKAKEDGYEIVVVENAELRRKIEELEMAVSEETEQVELWKSVVKRGQVEKGAKVNMDKKWERSVDVFLKDPKGFMEWVKNAGKIEVLDQLMEAEMECSM